MREILLIMAAELPTSFSGFVFDLACGLVLAIIFGSFLEFVVHRYIMHTDLLPRTFRAWRYSLTQVYRRHTTEHHRTYYQRFDHEEDPYGKEISISFTWREMLFTTIVSAPAVFFIALFSPVAASAFILVPVVHFHLWNLFHREMHQPKHPWWTRTKAYRFLARHHFLHHSDTRTNFNVILPLADFALGTAGRASAKDLIEIKRLGYSADAA